MDNPASIKRLPLPILAKPPKEVKEISKYFKTVGLSGAVHTGVEVRRMDSEMSRLVE